MKLYYSPGACSLAPHIALTESGVAHEAIKVDLRTHKLANGTDFYLINPKGYVPLLELDNGDRLSEVAVILQYIADRKPGTLAPAFGTMERYHAMEWLNFIATELHKQYSPLWHAETPEATKQTQRTKIAKRFDLIVKTLEKQPYLNGENFSIADAYLFTIVNWSAGLKVDLSPWPALQQFQARVAARPKVQEAIQAERTKAPANANA